MKNYYKILEIEYGADILSVKKAYRNLALRYHPDVCKDFDATQKFIEITEAYEVLRDPLKKNEYDVLYDLFFGSKKQYTETEHNHTSQSKQKEWTDLGKEKAQEYSSIPFEEFARRLLKEISVGASYIPNAIAIFIVLAGAIGFLMDLSRAIKSDSAVVFIELLMIVSLIYLAYRLFLVAKSDYFEDRKNKIK